MPVLARPLRGFASRRFSSAGKRMPRLDATVPQWLSVRSALAAFGTLLLAACGGGAKPSTPPTSEAVVAQSAPSGSSTPLLAPSTGAQAAPHPTASAAPPPRRSGAPHGLRNHGNTCAVSSVVQLLMHDDLLREQAQRLNANLLLDALHASYHGAPTTAAELDAVYTASVLNEIQRRYSAQEVPGQALDVVTLWSHSEGLGLPLAIVQDPLTEIPSQRAYAGERVFTLHPRGTSPAEQAGYASFADLPDPEQLRGFVYNTTGHYVAYVRIKGQWWRFSDEHLHHANEAEVAALRAQGQCGIAFAVYEPLVP